MAGPTNKGNILVVHDEPQITRVLKTTLSSHGYGTRIADDGDEALQVMKDWSPDLLITDLRMPNMDGLELCRRVRETSLIPIIVLSVKGEERTEVEALDAGADDYVTKPFNVNELLARVRAALRRAKAKDEPASQLIEIADFRIDLETRMLWPRVAKFTLHRRSLIYWCISPAIRGRLLPTAHCFPLFGDRTA